MHHIFRRIDRVWLYTAATLEQFDNELSACLRNEGGTLSDYAVVKDSPDRIPPGMVPELQPGDTVGYVLSPVMVARDLVRTSLGVKLQAAGLDLTDGEMALLTKGSLGT